MRFVYLLLAALLLAGCGDHLLESDLEAIYPIETDRTRYEAARYVSGQYEGVKVTIPMRFTNITADTVYFVGYRMRLIWCGRQSRVA